VYVRGHGKAGAGARSESIAGLRIACRHVNEPRRRKERHVCVCTYLNWRRTRAMTVVAAISSHSERIKLMANIVTLPGPNVTPFPQQSTAPPGVKRVPVAQTFDRFSNRDAGKLKLVAVAPPTGLLLLQRKFRGWISGLVFFDPLSGGPLRRHPDQQSSTGER
jgi:hypothetical protein